MNSQNLNPICKWMKIFRHKRLIIVGESIDNCSTLWFNQHNKKPLLITILLVIELNHHNYFMRQSNPSIPTMKWVDRWKPITPSIITKKIWIVWWVSYINKNQVLSLHTWMVIKSTHRCYKIKLIWNLEKTKLNISGIIVMKTLICRLRICSRRKRTPIKTKDLWTIMWKMIGLRKPFNRDLKVIRLGSKIIIRYLIPWMRLRTK